MKIKKFGQIRYLLAAFAFLVANVAMTTEVANADSNLCSGFSDCISKGYSEHNYQNNYTNSYWKALSGRNCTNYVGYMLTQNNDPGHDVLMDNAHSWDDKIQNNPAWGYAMNGTPAVGSIAQWEASTLIGESGHVAYVENVSSNNGVTTITISEDNYANGPYSWRTIASNSTYWPTRFLHIKDKVSTPVVIPKIIAVRNGTNLYDKHNVNDIWNTTSASTTSGFWLLTGNRFVNQDSNGLWVKDGDGSWERWGNGGSDEIQASSSRLVVRSGGNLYTKTSAGGTWELVSNTATQGFWKLSGDRIVNQDSNGLWVKDGNSSTVSWGNGGSDEIQVSENRIVTRTGSNLYTKTAAGGAWLLVSNSASLNNWKLTNDRIVNQDSNGLWVKDGNSSTVRWGNGGSEEIQASPTRIVVRSGGSLYENTSATGTWTLISNTATQGFWKLSGDRVVNQDTNGLWVRDNGGSTVRWGNGGSEEIQLN